MTIRSLSLYLSLCRGGEVKIGWHNVCGWKPEVENYLNLVLIPWPEEILPSHFRELKLSADVRQPEYRMFSFGVPPSPNLAAPRVKEILAAAERIVHKVDGIVLPESSIDTEQLEAIWETAASKNCLMIAGVRSCKENGFCGNHVETRFPIDLDGRESELDSSVRIAYSQEKHHRWKLDRSQLVSYGLASQLHIDDDWWEGIEMGGRNLNFCAIKPLAHDLRTHLRGSGQARSDGGGYPGHRTEFGHISSYGWSPTQDEMAEPLRNSSCR